MPEEFKPYEVKRKSPTYLLELGNVVLTATYDNTLLQMYRDEFWRPVSHIRVETPDGLYRVYGHPIGNHAEWNRELRKLADLQYPWRFDTYPTNLEIDAWIDAQSKNLPDNPGEI